MKTFIAKQEIRDLLNRVIMDEVSFTRMVEILNERVSERVNEAEKPCVEDIPKRKFKNGDKVRIKEGISSKTHKGDYPFFTEYLDEYIGRPMTVIGYESTVMGTYVQLNEAKYGTYNFALHEEWLEPYEELKKGDIAIFWDDNKGSAFIGEYVYFVRDVPYPHKHHRGDVWANAIKFESIEQYKKLLKGEI